MEPFAPLEFSAQKLWCENHKSKRSNLIKIPLSPEEVTAEWLTLVLRENKHLPESAKVTSIERKLISEGRGFANTSSKISATYDQPCPGLPNEFVVKIPNQAAVHSIFAGQADWWTILINQLYVCELGFYEEYASSCPTTLCKPYWGGIDYPEDPKKDISHSAILIEYLGDDLKLESAYDGVSLDSIKLTLHEAALIHADSFNNKKFDAVLDKGTNSWIQPKVNYPGMFFGLMSDASIKYYCDDFLKGRAPEEIINTCRKLLTESNLKQWTSYSDHGNECLSMIDLRPENTVYRRVGGTDEAPKYRCVLIDHQCWVKCAPGRDIAMYLGTALNVDNMDDLLQPCLQYYYEELTKAGVSKEIYTEEMFHKDIKIGFWSAFSLYAPITVKIIPDMEKMLETLTPGEAAYENTKRMIDDIRKNGECWNEKLLKGIQSSNANDMLPWIFSQ
eukprot:m.100793 g.100793  ORF g.100793 m.100793 type:complete len:447 (+) comp13723_c0_seq6:2492-3832(+)